MRSGTHKARGAKRSPGRPAALTKALLCTGSASCPSVTIDERSLALALAQSKARLAQSADQLELDDLYLVLCGIAQVPAAVVTLHERIQRWAGQAIRRVLPNRELGREVRERFVHEMLFATPPRIVQYAGRGKLKNWTRVAAMRTALNAARDNRRIGPLSNRMLAARVAPSDPESAYAHCLHLEAFETAFRQALAALSVVERNLIRHSLDGLTVREIGAMHATHFSTISRRLAAAREALRRATLEHLVERLGLSCDEVTSILDTALSEAGERVRRLLAPG